MMIPNLNGYEIDQGVFENTNVPTKELTNMQVTFNELAQTGGQTS